jgi:uncharacterized membrane protein YeaQ/YmgE (transglycosylase-associated protein family)
MAEWVNRPASGGFVIPVLVILLTTYFKLMGSRDEPSRKDALFAYDLLVVAAAFALTGWAARAVTRTGAGAGVCLFLFLLVIGALLITAFLHRFLGHDENERLMWTTVLLADAAGLVLFYITYVGVRYAVDISNALRKGPT